jgi:hypothetical protein
MKKAVNENLNGKAKIFATDDARYEAIACRDKQADGAFYYAVKTTGVYCRPSCSARLPRGRTSASTIPVNRRNALVSALASGANRTERRYAFGAPVSPGGRAERKRSGE